MLSQERIRNFCIIAHIDHGKSTLADRFLELTHTVEARLFREQFLDQMELERERGITIKLQPVRMEYEILNFKQQNTDKSQGSNLGSSPEISGSKFILNLVDTPGHVDFSYEVSRSLAAVEGAILLVDATQGIQAQTLANLHLAQKQGLTVIGAVNKIDLDVSFAQKQKLQKQLADLLNQKEQDIFLVSGKTGLGVSELLEAVVNRIPPPGGDLNRPFRALVFDSVFDLYKGVIAFVRVVDGMVEKDSSIQFWATKAEATALEIGVFKPQLTPQGFLRAGEIGYIATGIKNPALVRVGDTIIKKMTSVSVGRSSAWRDSYQPSIEPLVGYKEPQPVVFVSFYPQDADEFDALSDALSKLKLSDASLQFVKERQDVLGQGFRVGFLGTLHLEIVKERLKREYQLEPIITVPSVKYLVKLKNGSTQELFNAQDLPSADLVQEIYEPWVVGEIISPNSYLGAVLNLIRSKRGLYGNIENFSSETVLIYFEMPLSEIILDFYDKLKNVSQGYASLSYTAPQSEGKLAVSGSEFLEYRPGNLIKLDILIAGEKIGAFSRIVPKEQAEAVGRRIIERLKEILDRQLFPIPLQASVEGRIIARETLSALKKNVTGHLYGGDRTRKMKLWKKQKEGKKRLAQFGKVPVKPEVFFEVFKVSKE